MRRIPGTSVLLLLAAGTILWALIIWGNADLPMPLIFLRIFLGVMFVLFVPGFALQAALFPRPEEVDPLARIAFSYGLSIAILPPIFLFTSALRLEIRLETIAPLHGLVIVVCTLVAVYRRRRMVNPEISDPADTSNIRGWWASQDRVSRLLFFLLGTALSVAVVSGVWVSLETPNKWYSEFYFLDSQGRSEDYPRTALVGEPIVVQLAVSNHEGEESQYNIAVVQGSEEALATSGVFVLSNGETWQGSVTFELTRAGHGQVVEFILERVGSPWPYRTLRIWMNVDPSDS